MIIYSTHENTGQQNKVDCTNLFIEIHEEQSSNLTHSLAVSDLSVVHRVRGENMKQSLLPVEMEIHRKPIYILIDNIKHPIQSTGTLQVIYRPQQRHSSEFYGHLDSQKLLATQ